MRSVRYFDTHRVSITKIFLQLMMIDPKLRTEREVMSLTTIEKVSAFSALWSLEQDNFCIPCLETTAEHMAAVKRFLTDNEIEISNCDVGQVLSLLNVAINSHPKLRESSSLPRPFPGNELAISDGSRLGSDLQMSKTVNSEGFHPLVLQMLKEA